MATRLGKSHIFSLSIASVLALSACGGAGGSGDVQGQTTASDADKGPSTTKESKLAGSQIAVAARGALAANVGPIMQVRANGQLIGTVEVRSPSYQTYYFSTPVLLANGRPVEVSFINDEVIAGTDRNLYVQSISVDGKTFASTDPEVRYLRGWDEIAGQQDMLWNGTLRLNYSGNQGLIVRARGSLADGIGPLMDVRFNGQSIAQVPVRNTEYDDYTLNLPTTLPPNSKLDIVFLNDTVMGAEDRNLYIESVTVNGRQVKSTDPSVTYDRGALDGVAVIPGQEAMLWNGGLRFSLGQAPTPKLGFSWANEHVWRENFDGLTVTSGWVFNPGSEFGGGAKASPVSLVAVPSGGKALEFEYDTTTCRAPGDCPVYAAVVHKLAQPALADTLRFRIKNSLAREARVFALVKDSAGQTLQYRPERCPFETASDDWCGLEVDLRRPAAHWGGANNGVIKGNITELSLLVQSLDGVRGRLPVKGKLQFDDVVLAKALSTVSLTRGNAGAKWRDLSFAGTTEKLGVAVHFKGDRKNSEELLKKAKEAGFGFIRTDLFWNSIEPKRTNPASYDFTAADHLIDAAGKQNLKVLFILAYENRLYGDGMMGTETERNAFAAYAAAAAARYKGKGVRFEIWNEQNSGAWCSSVKEGFWLPKADGVSYGKLVNATMKAIRAVDPNVEVTIGGLTPSFTSSCGTEDTLFSFQYMDDLHKAGGFNSVNALGYHPYFDIGEQWGTELQMLRTQLREKGFPALPVWDTEWGVSSACPDGERPCAQGSAPIKRDRQAVRLARRFLVGLSLGLPVNVWYDLKDAGTDPSNREHHFGLYDHSLNGKPALAAMQTLAAVSKERLSGVVPDLPAGMHAVRFEKGTDTVYAVWVERGSLELRSDTTGLINAVDVQGRALHTSGVWTLRESDGPIYLTYR